MTIAMFVFGCAVSVVGLVRVATDDYQRGTVIMLQGPFLMAVGAAVVVLTKVL